MCFLCVWLYWVYFLITLIWDSIFLLSMIFVWLLGIICVFLDSYLSSSISMFSSLLILDLFLLLFGLDRCFCSVVSHWWFVFMFICIIFPCSLLLRGRSYWWLRFLRYTEFLLYSKLVNTSEFWAWHEMMDWFYIWIFSLWWSACMVSYFSLYPLRSKYILSYFSGFLLGRFFFGIWFYHISYPIYSGVDL